MVKRVVPGLVGAVLAAAIGWLGLQYWGAGTPPWTDSAGESAVPPISGSVGNFTPTIPERPAPIEPFYDADGHEVTLQGFGGKVVLLNLWATWCAPCLKELPSLDRLQAQLGGDRFQVVAVSVDRRGVEAVRPFFEKLKITHLAIYIESKDRFAQALGLQILPSTIIIGPHGLMAGKMIGAAEWDAPEALALLRHYIDQAATAIQNRKTAAGKSLTLADFRGRVVLLNFWTMSCVPRQSEMPSFDRLQAMHQGDGLAVLAVSVDDAGGIAVRRFFHPPLSRQPRRAAATDQREVPCRRRPVSENTGL